MSTMSAGMAHDICVNTPDGVMNFYLDQATTCLVLNLRPAGGANNLYMASVLDLKQDRVSRWLVRRWDRLFVGEVD